MSSAIDQAMNVDTPIAGEISVVVSTDNVVKELLSVATSYNVSVKTLSFRLLKVQTFVRMPDGDDEWHEMSTHELYEIPQEVYLDEDFEIRQMYEINIFDISKGSPLDTLDIAIAGNKSLSKIYLTIKAGCELTYEEGIEKSLLALIMRKKLRANLMVGVFDSMVEENIAELINKLKVHKTYVFTEQARYLVAESFEPIATIDDNLILHYKRAKSSSDKLDKIDYSKRDFVVNVNENDLLIEYIKPFKGSKGRNVKGELVLAKEPVVRFEPRFTIDEKIRRDDLEKTIEYRALSAGYVTFENGEYSINSEMNLDEISFQSTGSIDIGLDTDIVINVREKDALKDAIGAGTIVTVNSINIDGNVGADARITANQATIDGQVHNSAIVTADELRIGTHKGMAVGKDIYIDNLEHGEVIGEKVFITRMIGGSVRAKEIVVEILGSRSMLTASKSIEIKKLQGGENILTIDPLLNEARDVLDNEVLRISEAKQALQKIEKELMEYEGAMKKNAALHEDMKKKLQYYKSNDIKVPAAHVEKLQQFQGFLRKLESIREECTEARAHYEAISIRQALLQSEILGARIINRDRWRNYNEVVFKLINPRIDVTYAPVENSREEILCLEEDMDGKFSVKVARE